MKFRTELIPPRAPFILDPSRPAVLLGSCFATNILARMQRCGWEAVNPLGTLYNPFSILSSLRLALLLGDDDHRGKELLEQSLFFSLGKWRSWLYDTSLASEEKDRVIEAFAERGRNLCGMLRRGAPLFITFGTAWCYYLSDDREYVVANCHKQPVAIFERRRAAVGEIAGEWIRMADTLKQRFPDIEIVFTVSPVRHLKDGFEGNSLSKAILRLAVEEICSSRGFCHYFPAYEIVNDDLRDYRFYASDLVHPSDQAVEYIWEKFRATFLDPSGEALLRQGEKAWKASHHRPHPSL